MWTECVKATNNHKDLPDWQQRYMDFMFEVNDTSGWFQKPVYDCCFTKILSILDVVVITVRIAILFILKNVGDFSNGAPTFYDMISS